VPSGGPHRQGRTTPKPQDERPFLVPGPTYTPATDPSHPEPDPARSFDALLPPEIARAAEQVGVAKATMRFDRLFVLGMLAGAFIGLGAMFSTVVTAGGGIPPGIARLLAGVVFSLGLVLVVIAGAELFTGNNLMVIAFASRRIRLTSLLRAWGIVYVANFVGALATALVVYWSGETRDVAGVGQRALQIAETKTSLGFGEAILLGVLANALVCLAVWLALSARSVTDKILAIILPVAAFVAAGFEHSIANMYFIPSGLFLKAWAPDSFWASTGTTQHASADVTWYGFIVDNLIPVTIGNIIGGAILVALVYWYVYRRDAAATAS
jgi:formate/nitrite transporter